MNKNLASLMSMMVMMSAGSAAAQDAWTKSTMIVPDRLVWSGVYAGVQGGYGQADAKGALAAVGSLTAKPQGGFVGGHIGFNHQVEHLVFGVEADMEASGIRRTYRFGPDSGTLSSAWMGSLRARFGMAFDSVLVYATAGFSVAEGSARINATALSTPEKQSETFYGHTFGFGVEYAFSRNFSMRAEWRTSRYQPKTYSFFAPGDARLDLAMQTVRVGQAIASRP
ncbi:MAG: porin family protein [Candidatus Competibacteraceae bacterium]|nr:porin family protein [Candidatus Competibacteraceae bacterium]